MYSDEKRQLALGLKNKGKTYACIEWILGVTNEVVRQLCRYFINKKLMKRGPKFIMSKTYKLQVKR